MCARTYTQLTLRDTVDVNILTYSSLREIRWKYPQRRDERGFVRSSEEKQRLRDRRNNTGARRWQVVQHLHCMGARWKTRGQAQKSKSIGIHKISRTAALAIDLFRDFEINIFSATTCNVNLESKVWKNIKEFSTKVQRFRRDFCAYVR